MDLSKRGHLTPSEKTLVSQSLQVFVLDAIASSVHDMQGRLMFHGGTAISTVHGSPRWSEDLDFMINPDMSHELDAVHDHVEEVAREKIDEITPGAKFDLIDKGKARGKVRDADPGTVMRWTGRWEHPSRIGVVKMKTEFYIAEPEAAARYRTQMSSPEAVGLYSEARLPTATLDTIWADKIMAMSARPVMKWRDVYDMGFIMDNMTSMSDDYLFDRLKVACQSYRSNPVEIHQGLSRDYLEDLDKNFATFRDDMNAWLPGAAFEKAQEKNTLKRYHTICVEQIERAKEIIRDRVPQIEEAQVEEDYSCGF
jgi:predicted nucleotidyltransferase component of viral defense system